MPLTIWDLPNEDGKRRLRTEVHGIRVSTREDGPNDYLTSIKEATAPRHDGYIDVARTHSRDEAEATHVAVVRTIELLDEMRRLA